MGRWRTAGPATDPGRGTAPPEGRGELRDQPPPARGLAHFRPGRSTPAASPNATTAIPVPTPKAS